jgi:hypothetical protein
VGYSRCDSVLRSKFLWNRFRRHPFPSYTVIVMAVIEAFMRWWNYLAQHNGKLKFKTQREAAEFVRRAQNENGGPNAKILEMRKRYDEVNRAKATDPNRFDNGGHQAIRG